MNVTSLTRHSIKYTNKIKYNKYKILRSTPSPSSSLDIPSKKTINLFKKKRAIIDIRGLNRAIVTDIYPIPLQSDIISSILEY